MKGQFKKSYLVFCTLVAFLVSSQIVQADLPDFKSLVKKTAPAVVNISAVKKASKRSGFEFRGPNGEDLPDIFKPFFPDSQKPAPGKPRPQSQGSGFIISEDGFILTNHHVIEGASEIFVKLNDRRELEAEIIGSDKRSDIALLKINATDLPTVKLGTSANLEPGEWVLAIGSPFGFDYSVTSGIVSATGRALRSETYVPFIQTDVAINPGNSGGPLFNLEGEVVGINSQIYTRSGGFMGVSFAIPVDIAMNVVEQLREQGVVNRGWLGVVIQEVSKDLAESFGLAKPEGALVVKVLPDSPAEAGGLQEGDIILKFNASPINLSADLPHKVGIVPPGKSATLEIVRSGEVREMSIKIGMLPDQASLESGANNVTGERTNHALNLVLQALTSEEVKALQIEGVKVVQVKPGVGAQAGLQVGDIITMLDGEKVQNLSQLNDAIAAAPKDKAIPMRIVRRGSPIFIPIKLQK